ncbi:helix-turn-helix domain-containing protein [Streptomyces sp. NBC_01341]|uniref:helix-turn-helix domain-containing protein n=1 Tax=Streptomyces sp. NBC_01341 TaxID=2903831 RepID=UPI003FA3D28C
MDVGRQPGGAVAAVALTLGETVRRPLERLVASAKAQVREVLRARIVLAAADGLANAEIARELDLAVNTVRKWRGRFAEHGAEGLKDAGRPGRPTAPQHHSTTAPQHH